MLKNLCDMMYKLIDGTAPIRTPQQAPCRREVGRERRGVAWGSGHYVVWEKSCELLVDIVLVVGGAQVDYGQPALLGEVDQF